MTSSELLALLRASPEKGLREIVHAYGALVQKTVRQTGGGALTAQDVEELVNDVFYGVYTSREQIDETKGSLSTYIMLLARRRTVDRLRRTRFGEENALPLEENEFFASVQEPETDVLALESRKRLAETIAALGMPDSTTVMRRFYFDEDYRTIGRRLGMSANAVAKRCRKALKKLKKELKERDAI